MNKITEKMVVAQKTSRRELKTLGSNIFYLEKRPQEKGRTTLIYENREVLPKEFDIKSKVHEYGGGSYVVSTKFIIFVNKKDQQLYIMDNLFEPKKLTDYPSCRFADGIIDQDEKCSYWVCEEHNKNDEHDVVNTLVCVSHAEDSTWGSKTIVHSGQDFYAAPALYLRDKDYVYNKTSLFHEKPKKKLAFISWNHPNMPWDETYLHLGVYKEKNFEFKVVDSGAWISQPQFSEKGLLYYVKELDHGYSNICSFHEGGSVEISGPILKNNREYALPAWNFGAKTYALYQDKIIAGSWQNGQMQLEIISKGQSQKILEEYAGFSHPQISHDNLIIECYSFDKDSELVSFNLQTFKKEVLIKASDLEFEVSKPEPITFESNSKQFSHVNGLAHGFLYLPTGKKENLPLIVISHGGPTGMSTPFFEINIQYWTDKGFAVFDVNYRGSTGYGKQYRNALKGNWGIADVVDCENAALYCVNKGIANKDQLIIRGSSAGGYTTMAALTFTNTFKAGASYYGICDLNMLAESTHKFESRYMDSLIAPYQSNPEEFHKRSPVNFMDRINCPMIVFQGKEDKVVPPDQAYTIYNNLITKNVFCELHIFEEEGHGFGQEKNLITCLQKELAFYHKIFGK